MKNATRSLAIGLLLGAWVSTAAFAESSVLGHRGAVHALKVTTWGAVQANVPPDQAGNPVLALETRSGGTVSLVLVPTTEDAARENSENLVFERVSSSLFAAWQGFIGIHPVVYLAEFRDGTWSAPIMVTRDAFAAKYSPQMVVTRDSSGTGAARFDRTILHVVYAQEPTEGQFETLYAPVVFHNGRYAGQHPVYRLNDLATAGGGPPPTYPVSRQLLQRPSLQRGADDRSLVASFVDAASGRLLTAEIGHLPIQLSRIASEARAHIIIAGVRGIGARGSVQRQSFANEVYADVYARSVSHGFTPGSAIDFADAVRQVVLAEDGEGEPVLQRIAGEARAHIIIAGARGRSHGLESASLASAIVSWTLGEESPDEDVHFELLANRVAPRSGNDVENQVYSSADGQRALVAWTDGIRYVRYREAEGSQAWSEIRELTLSKDLSLQVAREILDSKAR